MTVEILGEHTDGLIKRSDPGCTSPFIMFIIPQTDTYEEQSQAESMPFTNLAFAVIDLRALHQPGNCPVTLNRRKAVRFGEGEKRMNCAEWGQLGPLRMSYRLFSSS